MEHRFFAGTGGADAPILYVVDMVAHPFDFAQAAQGLTCHVATLPVEDWNAQMTPWPAPGLYKGEDAYPGKAAQTLAEFANNSMPAIEEAHALHPRSRAIAGYSLGGLFALWSLITDDVFDAAASMSGSLWYPRWLDWLAETLCERRPLTNKYAYLSLGTKEKRARPEILKTVEVNTLATRDAFEAAGATTSYTTFPGGHMTGVPDRIRAGLIALDAHLARS